MSLEASLEYACPKCSTRMRSVPPGPAFRATCVRCAAKFVVRLAAAAPPPPPPAAAAAAGAGAGAAQPAVVDDTGEADAADAPPPAKDVFVDYTPTLPLEGAQPHPGDIVESNSLAATPVPLVPYVPVYCCEESMAPVVSSGKLSALQLETVALCGARHEHLLPDGRRAGFFLGDGAGVGKGRQIAAVIVDNYARGRRKHVWFSTSTDLRLDAERDLRDIGAPGVAVHDGCQQLDRETRGLGLGAAFSEGVVFSTYASLVSAARQARGGESRLQQLVRWCGAEAFDGCVVFDECHKAKNFKQAAQGGGGGGGEGGASEVSAADGSSKVSAAVIQLQRLLPRARVLYASATGVSEPSNMAYMERLGLWGPGSAFGGEFSAFLEALEARGVGAMELLAMEMKASGMYTARGLSFRAAEFEVRSIRLSAEQRAVYDGAAAFWRRVHAEIGEAKARLEAKGGAKGPGGKGGSDGSASSNFFKQLCVASKVPQVVGLARAALQRGECVVIGLQMTGESALVAELSRDLQLARLPSSCREILRRLILERFPTEVDGGALAKKRAALDERARALTEAVIKARAGVAALQAAGADASGPMAELLALSRRHTETRLEADAVGAQLDAAAHGPCHECTTAKARLLRELDELPLPPCALDWLVDELGGPEAVAEMTGRRGRMVRRGGARGADGGAAGGARFAYALRTPADALGGGGGGGCAPGGDELEQLNVLERKAFCEGRKLVAIISDAASTGISLHADVRTANQRRRVHITLELPWSADKAVQQLGRSHRSNQSSAPVYVLAQTELGGEARFASAVAKRLELMGALTRGDRRAASGADLRQFNYDTAWGRKALQQLLHALATGAMTAGVDYAALAREHARAEAEAAGLDPAAAPPPLGMGALHCRLKAAAERMGFADELKGALGGPEADGALGLALGAPAPKAKKSGATVKKFLNKLLTLGVSEQNLLFSAFHATLEALISAAVKDGKYDAGVGDVVATSIVRKSERVLWTDPATRARTRLVTLACDRGVAWEEAVARYSAAVQGAAGAEGTAGAAEAGEEEEEAADGSSGSESGGESEEEAEEEEGGGESGVSAAAAAPEAAAAPAAAAAAAAAATAPAAAPAAAGRAEPRPRPRRARRRRHDGFYASIRKFQGRHTLYALALSRAEEPRAFSLVRPNTGAVRHDVDLETLRERYVRVSARRARAGWEALHALADDESSGLPARRFELLLLSGTLTPLWPTLLALVNEHALKLTRAEQRLSVVRVQTTDCAERVVGIKWARALLPYLRERLEGLGAAKAAAAHAAGGASATGETGAADAIGAPIERRALEKVLTPKPTILSFFAAKGQGQGQQQQHGGGSQPHPPQRLTPPRAHGGGGSGGAESAIELDAATPPPARGLGGSSAASPQLVDLTSDAPTVRQLARSSAGAAAKRPLGAAALSAPPPGKRPSKQPAAGGGSKGAASKSAAISKWFRPKGS